MFVLLGKLVTFNPSMGFNITTLGQKVTVYEGTVGLDVTRNKAAGVKSFVFLQPFIVNYLLLYCQVWTIFYRIYVFTSYCFPVIFMLPWNDLVACR